MFIFRKQGYLAPLASTSCSAAKAPTVAQPHARFWHAVSGYQPSMSVLGKIKPIRRLSKLALRTGIAAWVWNNRTDLLAKAKRQAGRKSNDTKPIKNYTSDAKPSAASDPRLDPLLSDHAPVGSYEEIVTHSPVPAGAPSNRARV
jgi:hypothetical protein